MAWSVHGLLLLVIKEDAGKFVSVSFLQRSEELNNVLGGCRTADRELLPVSCPENRVTGVMFLNSGFARRHRFDLFSRFVIGDHCVGGFLPFGCSAACQ